MGNLLIQNFTTIAQIMNIFAITAGVFLTFMAIMEFKKMGEQRSMMSQQHGAMKPTILLLCGAMLLILPSFLGTAMLAFWGHTSDMAYLGDTSGYSSLAPAVLAFVRLIGLGSFIRGIILLSRAGGQQSQPGVIGKALIHIFAGILCLHVVETMNLLGSILGVV